MIANDPWARRCLLACALRFCFAMECHADIASCIYVQKRKTGQGSISVPHRKIHVTVIARLSVLSHRAVVKHCKIPRARFLLLKSVDGLHTDVSSHNV